jgi:hypothetical protein
LERGLEGDSRKSDEKRCSEWCAMEEQQMWAYSLLCGVWAAGLACALEGLAAA